MRIHNKIHDAIQNMKVEEKAIKVEYLFQKETNQIQNILRFLQLFAEGHFTVL